MFFIQKGMFLYEWECSFLLIYNKFVAKKLFFDTHNKIFFIYAGVFSLTPLCHETKEAKLTKGKTRKLY